MPSCLRSSQRIGIICLVGDEGVWRPLRQSDPRVVAVAARASSGVRLKAIRSASGSAIISAPDGHTLTPQALPRRSAGNKLSSISRIFPTHRATAPARSHPKMPRGREQPRFPSSVQSDKTRKIGHSTSVRSPQLKAASPNLQPWIKTRFTRQ